jgi:hypothetical protein
MSGDDNQQYDEWLDEYLAFLETEQPVELPSKIPDHHLVKDL